MKTDLEKLQKQLHDAEIKKLRIIDEIKQIKSQIEEANREPSIYELMPIGSVWCGWKVVGHDKKYGTSFPIQIYLMYQYSWPSVKTLRNLISEQRKLDAMKKAADAALNHNNCSIESMELLKLKREDYKKIVENETKANAID